MAECDQALVALRQAKAWFKAAVERRLAIPVPESFDPDAVLMLSPQTLALVHLVVQVSANLTLRDASPSFVLIDECFVTVPLTREFFQLLRKWRNLMVTIAHMVANGQQQTFEFSDGLPSLTVPAIALLVSLNPLIPDLAHIDVVVSKQWCAFNIITDVGEIGSAIPVEEVTGSTTAVHVKIGWLLAVLSRMDERATKTAHSIVATPAKKK